MHEDSSEIIRALIAEKGLTQAQLAERARISQSTVSRMLRSASKRYGRARQKLFTYARRQEPSVDDSTEHGPKRVATAFHRIWDGTDAHAAAIVRIINALAGLRPKASPGKGRMRERQRKSPQATSKKHRP